MLKRPTELGNVICGYETYATTKYGLDGAFFWPRIWMLVDKDLRIEIDEAQSIADCATYISFIFLIFAILYTAIFLIDLPLQHGLSLSINPLSNWGWVNQTLLIAGLIVLARVFYSLSVSNNATFGEQIKAMYDNHILDLSIEAPLPNDKNQNRN